MKKLKRKTGYAYIDVSGWSPRDRKRLKLLERKFRREKKRETEWLRPKTIFEYVSKPNVFWRDVEYSINRNIRDGLC